MAAVSESARRAGGEEAAAYSGIGINKLREITNDERCRFVLWVDSQRLIKRYLLDKYPESAHSI